MVVSVLLFCMYFFRIGTPYKKNIEGIIALTHPPVTHLICSFSAVPFQIHSCPPSIVLIVPLHSIQTKLCSDQIFVLFIWRRLSV